MGDLLRCTFVFENKTDMQKGLAHIIATRHNDINLIKNGWASYTPDKHGEYVDVTIIFVLPNGVCCEVQLLTKPLYDFKKCLHKDYGMMRIINSPKGTELSSAIKKWTEAVERRQRCKTKMAAVAHMARRCRPVQNVDLRVSASAPPKPMKSKSKRPRNAPPTQPRSGKRVTKLVLDSTVVAHTEQPQLSLRLERLQSGVMGDIELGKFRRRTTPATKKRLASRKERFRTKTLSKKLKMERNTSSASAASSASAPSRAG